MACKGQWRGRLIVGGILVVISIAGIGIAIWLLSEGGEGDGECGTGCSDLSYKTKTCVFKLTLEQLFTDTAERIADGGPTRPVLVFNGALPGPSLVVCEGDNVRVELKNRLSGNDPALLGSGGFNVTTLHFHGIRQKQRKLLTSSEDDFSWSNHGPWSDGVPMVTQCPLPAGEDFHYQFEGNQGQGVLATFNNAPAGSYWYHSHVGNQRLNGAAGKLIVMPRKAEAEVVDRPENSLFLQEWYNATEEVYIPHSLLVNGKGKLRKNANFVPTLEDGESLEEFMTRYFMGRSVFFHEVRDGHNRDPRAQYEIFTIPENDLGKKIRFRLISGIGQETNIRVSIEDHSFTAIATDAIDIQETGPLDAVWLAAGERYDILVKTKTKEEIEKHPSAYKINIYHSYSHNPNTTFELCSIAWLRYAVNENAFQTVDETFEANCKSMREESFQNPVLNPTPNKYANTNTKAIYPKDLRAKSQAKNIKQVLNTHYVNMTCIEDKNNKTWCNFNNYQMPFPAAQTSGSVASSGYQEVPFLFQSPSNQDKRCGAICNKTTCRHQGPQELSNCSHILQQPDSPDHWFEVVLINQNPDGKVAHPIHQHGGWYNVIGQGQYPPTINITQELIIKKDTECEEFRREGRRCLPRNFDYPVFKDSVQIPTNGYVIIRTPLDNPGTWIVHCHINYHVEHGMAMVFQFGEPKGWAMGSSQKVAQTNKDKRCFK